MKPRINENGIKYLFSLFIISCILITIFIPGCNQTVPQSEPAPPTSPPENLPTELPESQIHEFTVSSAPSSEIKVDLSMTGSPMLGRPVEVTAIFGLREEVPWDAENVTAEIILPEEFELVSGQLEWRGDVLRGKKYEISAIVKAVNIGDNLEIKARAFYDLGTSFVVGSAYLYTQVSKDRAAVSDQAFSPAEVPRPTPTEPPTEFPSKPPAEPGDIAPQPPDPVDNVSLSSEEVNIYV